MSKSTTQSTEHSTPSPRKDSSRMKLIAVVTLIALALGLFGGWAIAAVSTPDAQGDVWVIPAQSGEALVDSIVLEGPAPAVVGITLDDGREASPAQISTVVQRWDDVFGDDTPRAILYGTSDGTSHSVIVELGQPTATAESITFPATPVGSSEIPEFAVTGAVLLIDGSGLLEPGSDLAERLGS